MTSENSFDNFWEQITNDLKFFFFRKYLFSSSVTESGYFSDLEIKSETILKKKILKSMLHQKAFTNKHI
jgi:hypothetical protein